MARELGFSTRCIHPQSIEDAYGAPHTPIYNTTTFAFPDTAALLDVQRGRKTGGFYTRHGMNPTIVALERQLALLEQAEAALAFTAGMATISATCLAHGRGGVVCLGDVYGGTMELVGRQLPQLGIRGRLLRADEVDQLEGCLAEGFGLVLLETPCNPTLEVHDIAAVAAQVRRHGALLAVDSTFATPVNQRPLAFGANLVIHAATKYLGGHSDLTAGALMGSRRLLAPVWEWRKNLGQAPAPETAALLARSLRTLAVRIARHNASAQAVAEAMVRHPRVRRVLYPGLPDFPGHAVAKRQMSGFGGMLTLELATDAAVTTAVVDRLRLFLNAPSLGGVESLATQPVTTTHYGIDPEERARRGITDSMIRLSVGLEDSEDLIADLEQALAGAM